MYRKPQKWVIKAIRAPFTDLGRRFRIDPVTARVIVNRGISEAKDFDQYINGTGRQLPDPLLMKDMDKGTDLVCQKIREGKRIRIISDYDVDGVSSNYILYQGLLCCGARVDYVIPDRIEDGYGMNSRLIRQAAEDGINTVITCDNGISARAEIEEGKALGLTFVITDHHEVPFTDETSDQGEVHRRWLLPDAAAVIDPKQEDCPYPEKTICGAVVAWKFIQVLYRKMGIDLEEADAFLEMAALATVCDVMPLTGENRIIVKEGLGRIKKTRHKGLSALIRVSGLDPGQINATSLGFVIGPSINATGRLANARLAMELLLCQEEEKCLSIASDLRRMNEERKQMTISGQRQAVSYLEETGHADDPVLVVYLPDCHESIAGIIAGRIRDQYYKPAFVITKGKEGLKGSGRSIEAYSMFEEMTKADALLDHYGGHPMAAGLSLQEDNLEAFRARLNETSRLTPEDLTEKIVIDAAMPFSYISEKLIRELEIIEPCGKGNRKPLFAQKELSVLKMTPLGKNRNMLKFLLCDREGYRMTGLYFQDGQALITELKEHYGTEAVRDAEQGKPNPICLDLTYLPRVNLWNGQKNIEILIRHYHIHRKDKES